MTTFNQTPAGGTVPTAYSRGPLPLGEAASAVYLRAELGKIEKAISSILELVPQAAIKAPAQPIENMIRFSKDPWRPVVGQVTDRWVTYVAGAWVYLNTV